MSVELKIGKHTYNITRNDVFMDNGFCVQLLTQSKRPIGNFMSRPNPVLSKRTIKQINDLGREKIDAIRFSLSI